MARVVNARHVKHAPGRKTDVGDAQWLATLARVCCGGSFVPPANLRELRLIARQRQKWVGQLASEKNRLLLIEIGSDMGVFGSVEHFASWVGLCPGNHESAGKRKSGHVRNAPSLDQGPC
jgi:transposase